jgi:predicted kinase
VLDASFSKRVWRDYLLREAGIKGVSVYFVRTTATLDEVELRLLRREKEGVSISDAGAAILPRFLSEWEEPAGIKGGRYFEADTERPGRESLDALFRAIMDAGALSPAGQ